MKLFVGNCTKTSTVSGIQKVVDKCYEGEEVKPHVMIEEFGKSDSYRKAFVLRVGAPDGTSKCQKYLVTPYFDKLLEQAGSKREVAYCRSFGGYLPETMRNHGLTSYRSRTENQKLVSDFV